jgi:hypothetical protein
MRANGRCVNVRLRRVDTLACVPQAGSLSYDDKQAAFGDALRRGALQVLRKVS